MILVLPPPTTFARHNSSQNGMQRIQQEERNNRRTNKSISKVILALIRASRRPSKASTVIVYSQYTTLESEESTPSWTSSYMYSSSLSKSARLCLKLFLFPVVLLGAAIIFPVNVFFVRILLGDLLIGQMLHYPFLHLRLCLRMVEGLLHPRLGMALGSSQQTSASSLRDHVDYTRLINGVRCFFYFHFLWVDKLLTCCWRLFQLVNNHITGTTTFETQNTVALEGTYYIDKVFLLFDFALLLDCLFCYLTAPNKYFIVMYKYKS